MVKLKWKSLAALLCVGTLFCAVPALAASTGNVYDDAALLDETEAFDIDTKLTDLETATGWECYAFTTVDTAGKTSQEYGEYAFDDYATGMDGVAFVIDMDNREIAVVHFGEANHYLTDQRVESVLDAGYTYVSDEAYASCLTSMIDEVSDYYEAGIPNGQYNVTEKTKGLSLLEVLITVAVAVVAAGAVFGGVVGKYQLHWGTYKYDYHSNSKLKLKNQSDHFVNQLVTHHHIQKDPPSGGAGKTTVHSGAGGRSVGGGSRKF